MLSTENIIIYCILYVVIMGCFVVGVGFMTMDMEPAWMAYLIRALVPVWPVLIVVSVLLAAFYAVFEQ